MLVRVQQQPHNRHWHDRDGRKTEAMSKSGQQILVIGKSTPLLEGVADLLLLAGYHVDTTSSWAETEYTLHVTPPHLAIVDLSSAPTDAFQVSEQIRSRPRWSTVPILFISFSGDDRIWDLQRRSRKKNDNHVDFYAHTLLSVDGLLAKVEACLS